MYNKHTLMKTEATSCSEENEGQDTALVRETKKTPSLVQALPELCQKEEMKHYGQVHSMEKHFCLYPSSTTGTYHFMDGPIEAVVFCKDQQYYKGHIYMV